MSRLLALLLTVLGLCGKMCALDNAAWLDLAREAVKLHVPVDSGETPEDGIYCIAIAEIEASEKKSVEVRVEEATLEAKRQLTAYAHGETMSASRELTQESRSVSVGGQQERQSASTLRRSPPVSV